MKHIYNDEFYFNIQSGIIITSDKNYFEEKLPIRYKIIDFHELFEQDEKEKDIHCFLYLMKN